MLQKGYKDYGREKHTPNSKVEEVMNSPCARETVKKKLLFAEVLHQQLKENYSAFKRKEKRIFKRVISGSIANGVFLESVRLAKIKGLSTKNLIMVFKLSTENGNLSPPLLLIQNAKGKKAITHFTWNYHEAGHGKGAPDGVGAVCKRSADRLVGSGNDISSLNDLSEAIQKTCPNINVYLIDDMNILEKEALLATAKEQIKTFPDVYGPDSESEKENSSDSEHVTAPKYGRHQTEDAQQPSTSKNVFKNGDFILVKLLSKD
ncbi:hypothetical protein EVAR_32067_1 [Eumeta japonica]|uniref:Uncharacterized protein n=1 Tax=Eumeta variegata TaxID=151549 RepID=A0A4C1WMK2_EUMVA|nr:hypothetical protein EVAR_32067_1 [Eumeta japonica]